MSSGRLICWEALNADDPTVAEAGRLYATSLDPAECIPWAWIEAGVRHRLEWRPGEWSPHLILAGQRDGTVSGFTYGVHLPDFGGYACYLAVTRQARRQGLGARLLRLLMEVFRLDAEFSGTPLPFIVWESREPALDAAEEDRTLWAARLRLFASVGAWLVDGLMVFTPNFHHEEGEAVPLRLFLVPCDQPASAFDAQALRTVAAGLLLEVYGQTEDDPLSRLTLPPDCQPVLRPILTRNETPV